MEVTDTCRNTTNRPHDDDNIMRPHDEYSAAGRVAAAWTPSAAPFPIAMAGSVTRRGAAADRRRVVRICTLAAQGRDVGVAQLGPLHGIRASIHSLRAITKAAAAAQWRSIAPRRQRPCPAYLRRPPPSEWAGPAVAPAMLAEDCRAGAQRCVRCSILALHLGRGHGRADGQRAAAGAPPA